MGKVNYINVEAVEQEITKINNYIEELRQLCSNIDSDITRAWDSPVVRSEITPKIADIQSNIMLIERTIEGVSNNAGEFAKRIGVINAS